MNWFKTLLVTNVSLLIFSTSAEVAFAATHTGGGAKLSPPGTLTTNAITYDQILKMIKPKATSKSVSSQLVGKPVSLKLIATGPQALMVKRADMIFFVCDKKVGAFKSGVVNTTITKASLPNPTEEGEITFYLAECKN